jgi:hypothetical protein
MKRDFSNFEWKPDLLSSVTTADAQGPHLGLFNGHESRARGPEAKREPSPEGLGAKVG